MKKNIYVLKEEKVDKAILSLAVPSILTSMINTVYSIISSLYLAKLHNDAMVAATTVALPLTTILQSFADGIGIGASSYISRLLGKDELEKTEKVVKTAYTLAFFISAILSILMIIFLDWLLVIFEAEDDVVLYAKHYMTIVLIGGLVSNFKQILSPLLRAQGEIALPSVALIISVVVNLVLTPIFMYDWGFGLDIKGAALATVCSNLVATIIMLTRQSSNEVMVKWKLLDFEVDKESTKEIFRVGFSAFTRQILPSFSQTVLYRAAAPYGTSFLATMGIAKKSLQLVTTVYMGFSRGVQPLTAFCYGGRMKQRIKDTLRKSTIFVTLFGLAMSVLYITNGQHVVGLYSESEDIIHYGKYMLKGYAYSLPLLGIYQLYATTLQAFGKSKESFWISVYKQVIFYIPFVWILSALFQQKGIYMVQPATDLFTFIMLIVLCRNLPKEINEMEN